MAPEQYTVPTVVGHTLESARNLPEVKDIFTVMPQEESFYSHEYAQGEIAKQEPVAGETRKGDSLVIKV